MLPEARYVVIVRNPLLQFESVVRMWRSLFDLYGYEPPPSEDHIRAVVLADRLRFERKLTAGLAAIPDARKILVRYEDLVTDPHAALRAVYDSLSLGDYAAIKPAVDDKLAEFSGYRAAQTEPQGIWSERVRTQWGGIAEKYVY